MIKIIKVALIFTLLYVMVICITGCGAHKKEDADSSQPLSTSYTTMPTIVSTTMPTTVTTTKVQETTTQDDKSDILPEMSDLEYSDLTGLEFWFGSGAGAWSTIVEIRSDGTFSGYYHDSEMGSMGEDYPNGTLYECYFSGKFSALVKVGEYEYSMKCKLLEQEGTAGEEKIIDGVKVITSEPYGFDNADEFFLYLPGKKTDDLSEEFLSWVYGVEVDGVLPCYGLYNVGGGQGFSAWVE